MSHGASSFLSSATQLTVSNERQRLAAVNLSGDFHIHWLHIFARLGFSPIISQFIFHFQFIDSKNKSKIWLSNIFTRAAKTFLGTKCYPVTQSLTETKLKLSCFGWRWTYPWGLGAGHISHSVMGAWEGQPLNVLGKLPQLTISSTVLANWTHCCVWQVRVPLEETDFWLSAAN